MSNAIKIGLAIFAVLAAIVGYYWFADYSLLVRVLILVGGIIAGLAIAATSDQGRSALGFIAGSRNEIRKVVWPERPEVLQVTMWVLIAVLVTGVIIWVFDWAAYALIYRFILGVG